MTHEFKKAMTEKAIELCQKKLDALAEEISDELTGPDKYYRNLEEVAAQVAKVFAQRFVNENYDKIASLIDLERVAKMAELAAIGKTFQK